MPQSTRELPSGTLTFLFSDIEGSTRLLQRVGDRYSALLEEHRRLIRDAVAAAGGVEVGTEGDAFFVVFTSAPHAAAAAAAAQRALAAHAWPDDAPLKVRMGLHTGVAAALDGDYAGLDVHRAARIAAAAHGGQILLSEATKGLIDDALPAATSVRLIGEHRLKDLLRPEKLYQLVLTERPQEFPPPRTLDAVPNNLPTQLTSFVGRAREVEEARRHLERVRLLTLTGPGGTGKTRLSLQVAADVADRFLDGVYFAPLAPIVDPDLVVSSVARALDLAESPGTPILDRVLDHVRSKRILLVLDNFEQVLDAAPLVSDILKAGAGVKIIVTSRAPLHVSGEQEFPVPPLRLPDPKHLPGLDALSQYEAVALFIERAVAVRPDFKVTNENAPAVAEITSRLDGLPLAIELAAARIKLLTPQAILTRLAQRLNVLTGGARDLPQRQQTLRDAIAWSYDLLDTPNRRLMSRVAVFVGGCALEEAETVCGPADELGVDVVDGLATLVDHSLLRQTAVGGETRFFMLQTIREFAHERLQAGGEIDAIRRRHAHVYVDLAERAAQHLTGREQKAWLDRLERDHDNCRAAIGWAVEQAQPEIGLRLGAALWRFWQIRGHLREARDRLERILAIPGGDAHAALHARALEAAGGVAYWQGDMDRARAFYERSLEVFRAAGDDADVARALYNLSFVYSVPMADLDRARSLLEESLALVEGRDDPKMTGRVKWALAYVHYSERDYDAARRVLDSSLEILRAGDEPFSLAWALHQSGLIWARVGDATAAETDYLEALQIFADAHDVSGLSLVFDDLAAAAVALGDDLRGARLGGAASAVTASSGTDLAKITHQIEGRDHAAPSATDQAALEAAWAEGRAMSVDDAVAYAMRRTR